jgi:hypothetical protein
MRVLREVLFDIAALFAFALFGAAICFAFAFFQ